MITARYTKADNSEAEITIDGVVHAGCWPGSWQWIDMVRAGVTPSEYVEPEVVEPEPVRDLAAEFDALKAAVIEETSLTQEKIDAKMVDGKQTLSK